MKTKSKRWKTCTKCGFRFALYDIGKCPKCGVQMLPTPTTTPTKGDWKGKIKQLLLNNAEEPDDLDSADVFTTFRASLLLNELEALLQQAVEAERERIKTELLTYFEDGHNLTFTAGALKTYLAKFTKSK